MIKGPLEILTSWQLASFVVSIPWFLMVTEVSIRSR